MSSLISPPSSPSSTHPADSANSDASGLLPTRFLGARLTPALTLTESGFLFCARDGETYSLNKTGACLLRALQEGVAPLDAWRELVKRFEVPPPLAQRDAQLFLGRMFELGILELPQDKDDADATGTSGDEDASR